MVPESAPGRLVDDDALPEHGRAVIGRLDPHAFGAAIGVLLALAIFLTTIVPAVRFDWHLADHVGLLSQYLYGYTVTVAGAFLGAAYGLVIGYLVGQLFARARNFWMSAYLRIVWWRAESRAASDLLDRL
ncbi:MAG TPA: hypothetical protein VLA20_09055 [Vicinamibacterales bacterium]|nr:hypothetical protein [Vicinamibacterales bacterium]